MSQRQAWNRKWLPALVGSVFGGLWLTLWVIYVDPFPDRDSINQFYFPFLNYLKASSSFTKDFGFLVENTFSTSYPLGGAVFPWMISMVNMEGMFLQYPYLLNVFLILPLGAVPLFFRQSFWTALVLGILVFALPPTQILLKGFSLQAFNVAYALIAILSFRSYLVSRRIYLLVIFVIFFWLAIIPKHLGAFYFVNFCVCYGIWSLLSREFDFKVLSSILVIIVLSLPFYPWMNLKNYMVNVITHNPYLGINSFFFLGAAFLLVGSFLILYLQRISKGGVLPKFSNGPVVSLCLLVIATFVTTISYDADIGNLHVIIFFILGYSLAGFWLLRYRFSTTRGFMSLFCLLTFIHSLLLFCSMIGKTYYNFFLPILLVAVLEFVQTRTRWKRSLLVVGSLMISNFFPSINTMGELFGKYGENVYINGLNAPYVNPLGWESCEIPSLRRSLQGIYSENELGDLSNLYIAHKLHFHTKLALEFPHNFFVEFPSIHRLDNLPLEECQELLDSYKTTGEGLFDTWLNQGRIPILILGNRPFSSLVGDPPPLRELAHKEEPDLNDVSRSLGLEYFQYLSENGELKRRYRCSSVPKVNPRLSVCLLRTLRRAMPSKGEWVQSLADLATIYEMKSTRADLPQWLEYLPLRNRGQLERKWAGSLYEQAEEFRERKDLSGAYSVLRRVLNLDPSHAGALEDVLGLQEEMSPGDWEKVPKNYAPLDTGSIEESLIRTESYEENWNHENLGATLSKSERAHQLFILSNRFFNKDPERSKRLLQEVLSLNPQHVEARKDLEILVDRVGVHRKRGSE